jgi:hypothetical protein
MKASSKLHVPIVYVEWNDSTPLGGWVEDHELPPEMQCVSFGYLVREDRESITVAAHMSSHDSHSGAIRIPRACITRMEKYEKGYRSITIAKVVVDPDAPQEHSNDG